MEIMESIMWVGLGFIPTLAVLEVVAKQSHAKLGIPAVRAGIRLRAEVEA